jgi:hypothetical protein
LLLLAGAIAFLGLVESSSVVLGITVFKKYLGFAFYSGRSESNLKSQDGPGSRGRI